MNPDSFEPRGSRKPRLSQAKRVALVIFVCSGVLMAIVVLAIENSGMRMRSSEPVRLFEPAQADAEGLESASNRSAPPEEEPIPELEEEIAIEDVAPMVAAVPAYGAPPVSDQRREEHARRLLAADSKTSLTGFVQRDAPAPVGATSVAAVPDGGAETVFAPQTARPETPGGDPNGWEAKDKFLRDGGNLPEGYSKHFRTPQVSAMEIKAGTIVPCVLVSGINSDLPGNSIGQVSENVYDSATGRHLLIPKGSKVIGTYDNRISYGQSRVLIVWSKLVYPDGSTLVLENAGASDQSGYTGAKGAVNRHWNSILSSALIVSILGAGVEITSPSDTNGDRDEEDPRSIVAENAARSVAEAMSQVIMREASRQPTIKIKPGYRFLLFLRQDMLFGEAWSG